MDNEPAGASPVERMVRPAAEARWYCVSREGLATLCKDEADAHETVAGADKSWPRGGPHNAVQLVDAAAVEAALALWPRDCRLCANYTTASGGCVSVLRCVDSSEYKATTPRQFWEARPVEPAPF